MFKIPIEKDAVYDRDLLEMQIKRSLIDLQNLKDRSPDLEQMQHISPGKHIVSSRFGQDEIIIIPPVVVVEPEKRKKRGERTTSRILIGLERTDGSAGASFASWQNHLGSGALIGTISDGIFSPVIDLPWSENAYLLGPWSSFYSGSVQSFRFANTKQGGTTYNEISNGWTLEELDEADYDANVTLDYYYSQTRVRTLYDFYYTDGGTISHTVTQYVTTLSTRIDLDGSTIVGPFVRTITEDEHITQKPAPPSWTTGERTYTYSGEIVQTVGGLCIDTGRYLCLYGKREHGENNYGYIYSDDLTSSGWEYNTDMVYYGQYKNQIHALCSGTDFLAGEKEFNLGQYSYDYTPRCARIFKQSETNLIYLYSFHDSSLTNDEDDFLETPKCNYGAVIDGTNSVTTIGYELAVDEDGDATDQNVVAGMPTGQYSSILMRAYLEEKTEDDTYETEEI